MESKQGSYVDADGETLFYCTGGCGAASSVNPGNGYLCFTCHTRDFQSELAGLLNRFGRDAYAGTPDFILADHLDSCIVSLAVANKARDRHSGK